MKTDDLKANKAAPNEKIPGAIDRPIHKSTCLVSGGVTSIDCFRSQDAPRFDTFAVARPKFGGVSVN